MTKYYVLQHSLENLAAFSTNSVFQSNIYATTMQKNIHNLKIEHRRHLRQYLSIKIFSAVILRDRYLSQPKVLTLDTIFLTSNAE